MFAAIATIQSGDSNRFIERRYGDMRSIIRAAIDPRFQNKADEIGRVAERLVVIDVIKGGALFDASGHLQQTFGEATNTSYQTLLQTGRTIFRETTTDRLEFYYPPTVSETPFHILVRVASGEVSDLETIRDSRRPVIATVAGISAAMAVALIFLFLVAMPLRKVNRVMEATLANPAMADSGPSLRGGKTEVGQLASSVERMRSRLADMWRTKVMVADAILETAPMAVVQLTADGTPMFANAACAELFERDVVHTFGTTPLVVRDIETGEKYNLKVFLDTFGGEPRLTEIPTARSRSFAMIGGLVVGAETRSPTTIAIAADVSHLQNARLTTEADLEFAVDRMRLAGRRELELKLMLECCLTLLGGSKAPDVHIDILPHAREWLEAAREADLVHAVELSNEAPQVAGAPEELRAVMRLAILATYARLNVTPVDLVVEVRGINFETAGLVISARAAEDAAPHPSSADANLALAALRTAVKRVGGQVNEVAVNEDGANTKITLRGAAERLSTGMKNGAKG